jgi:hypothetical protein
MIKILKQPSYVDLVLLDEALPFEVGMDEGVMVIRLLLHIQFDNELLHRSPSLLARHLGVDLGWCSRVTNRMLREGLLEHEQSELEPIFGGPTDDLKAQRNQKNLILTLKGVGVLQELRDKHGVFWHDSRTRWRLMR